MCPKPNQRHVLWFVIKFKIYKSIQNICFEVVFLQSEIKSFYLQHFNELLTNVLNQRWKYKRKRVHILNKSDRYEMYTHEEIIKKKKSNSVQS